MNLENLTNRERCLLRAIGMLKDRKNYYASMHKPVDIDVTDKMYWAYDSAVAILESAWDEDLETLNQFDYFGKED